MNMSMLYNWTEEGLPSSAAWGNTYNEVWGHAADGREYAIIGTTMGTQFIDITDPSNPVEVDFVEGSATGPAIVHRDYHNMGEYLYVVCQEGASTLKVVDMSYLPDSVSVIYDSNEFFRGAHNIFIDTLQSRLYACFVVKTGVPGYLGLSIFDISNPSQPVLLEELFQNQDVHDMFVRDGIAYLNRGTSFGMQIWDFNELPGTMLGSITEYEGQGYNHSGYLTEDGQYYVMADETHGSPVKMLDVSDPTDIQVLSTVTSGVDELSIAHNQIIHDGVMYSAFYYDGIYAWNIEDPANPVLLGYYDTSTVPHRASFEGAWGVYPFLPSGNILVSDMQSGLWVFGLDGVTGIGESLVSIPEISVWPNPTTDYLSFNLKELGAEYRIFNIHGQKIASGNISQLSTRLDVSNLASGIYTLFVSKEGMPLASNKFVKN
jgi:choice-of-anchor B domain-containing protein